MTQELKSLPTTTLHDLTVTSPSARARIAEQWTAQRAVWLLVLALVVYVGFYSLASSCKFISFRQGFDLAQNEQTIWNTAQGRWFESSPFGALKYDFDDGPVPLELLLAVPYVILPGTFTLLFLQTVALAAGAIPIFALARAKLNADLALCFALAYLFHVTVTRMNMYEFQLRSFVVPFFLFGFYFFEKQRFGLFLLCAVLMLSCKTEVGFTLPVFGVYALLSKRSARWIITPVLMSLAWLLFVFGYVIPTFVPRAFITGVYGYGWLGNNFAEIIVTLITRPLYVLQNVLTRAKLEYVFQSFLLLLFLPLLKPRLLIFALPTLAMNLLATRSVQYSVLFFYQPFVIGSFFLASIYGVSETLPRWTSSFTRQLQIGIAALLLVMSICFNLTWNNLAIRAFKLGEPADRRAAAARVLAQIPANAAVAASSFLAPHLAQRAELYFFPGDNSYPFLENSVNYVVADLQLDTSPRAQALLSQMKESAEWKMVMRDTGYILFERRSE